MFSYEVEQNIEKSRENFEGKVEKIEKLEKFEEVEDLTQMKADYPAEIIQDPFLINRIVLSY